jgi:hypothetical protein
VSGTEQKPDANGGTLGALQPSGGVTIQVAKDVRFEALPIGEGGTGRLLLPGAEVCACKVLWNDRWHAVYGINRVPGAVQKDAAGRPISELLAEMVRETAGGLPTVVAGDINARCPRKHRKHRKLTTAKQV